MTFIINSVSATGTLPEAATGKSKRDPTSQSFKDKGFGCASSDKEEGNQSISQKYEISLKSVIYYQLKTDQTWTRKIILGCAGQYCSPSGVLKFKNLVAMPVPIGNLYAI